MNRKVRMGCLGVGVMMHRTHLPNTKRLEELELVAFCDTNPENLKIADEYDVKNTYTDHHQMLEKEDMDALFIAVPPFAHTDAEIIAAQRGIHLLVEKPQALTLQKAREINQAITQADVIAAVGFQERYRRANEQVKERLEKNPPLQVLVQRIHGGTALADWWSIQSKSGGVFVENGIHQVDLLRYLVGEIETVTALEVPRTHKTPQLDIPFSHCVTYHFDQGAVANITQFTGANKGGGRSQTLILCDDEVIEMQPHGDRIKVNDEAVYDPAEDESPYLLQLRAFVEAIVEEDKSKIRAPYDDAFFSLAAALAAGESARKGGQPIKLADFASL